MRKNNLMQRQRIFLLDKNQINKLFQPLKADKINRNKNQWLALTNLVYQTRIYHGRVPNRKMRRFKSSKLSSKNYNKKQLNKNRLLQMTNSKPVKAKKPTKFWVMLIQIMWQRPNLIIRILSTMSKIISMI